MCIVKRLFICGMMLFSVLAQAELPSAVADALKRAGIPQNNVAIVVQPVDAAAPSISLNAEKSMNPASVMKLVTTNAALDLLTPVFRWKTEIYRTGEVNGNTLNGDLIIKGNGDPSFGEPEFRCLLASLHQAGIKDIKGNLLIDKSYFAKNVTAANQAAVPWCRRLS